MKIAWLTDLHLNFCGTMPTVSFFKTLCTYHPDLNAIIISGDISDADDVIDYLKVIEQTYQKKIYFVLGNHDFYKGSIKEVYNSIKDTTRYSEYLEWLTTSQPIKLSKNTCIIGRESWNDGHYGDWEASNVILNDYRYIKEFTGLTKEELWYKLDKLARDVAKKMKASLLRSLVLCNNVILVTHVPPFKEACKYGGHISGDEYLPHYSNKIIGDMLLDVMKGYPDKQLTVLCGHTHNKTEVLIQRNLLVKVGGAEYGLPQLQEILDIS